ncbi:MAG: hypothetical protein KJS83_07780, partial [Xanthomonadaceae bacterium]|nr:hypothetical protein [Xanthomonadaceae bacterium]
MDMLHRRKGASATASRLAFIGDFRLMGERGRRMQAPGRPEYAPARPRGHTPKVMCGLAQKTGAMCIAPVVECQPL